MPAPRSKMISFRLSSEDYFRLRDACGVRGVDNISDLARAAVQRFLSNTQHSLDEELKSLRGKIDSLGNEVDRLSRLVGQSKGGGG